nr:hypothetical protein [Tanacetum cinerariifolium]
MEVNRKNKKGKQNAKPKHIDGIQLNKPKPKFFYRLVSKQMNESEDGSTLQPTDKGDSIQGEDNNFHNISHAKDFNDLESNEDDSDNEVIKNIILENPRFMGGKMKPNENKGASTPSNEVLKVLVFTYVDFNADLNLEDHSTGSSNIREFKDCVEEIEVLDINRLVLNFNWNKKPKGANGFLKKIDRIMANLDFLDSYVDLFNDVLHEEEATYVLAFNDALIMEERFLKQKAKIMDCVYSTSLSLSINGVLHGYFKGQRGLRQDSDSFTYHRYCEELDIINLCFADDLFLFAHGDTNSARVLMEALDEFKLVSRITPNLPKSTA